MKNHKPLILLCVFAFLLRVPGISWGINLGGEQKFEECEHNEPLLVSLAQEAMAGESNPESFYPRGFPFQIAVVASFIKSLIGPQVEFDRAEIFMIGRLLSVIYGTLTIALLFFLVKELTRDIKLAFLSSLFLSLAGLHVSRSHMTTTDVGVTFWLYALMYSLFLFIRTRKKRYFVFALISCGLVLSFKMIFVALIPIIYFLIRDRWNWKNVLLVFFSLWVIFMVTSGGQYTLEQFLLALDDVSQDNLHVRQCNKLLNIFSYTMVLIAGLGLPMFLLTIRGLFQGAHRKIQNQIITRKDVLFIVILPLFMQLVSICSFAYVSSRHILPLIPLFAVMAAFGFMSLRKLPIFSTNRRMPFAFFCLILYQLVFVFSVEHNFLFENREAASRWVRHNVPRGEKIYLTNPMWDKSVLYDMSVIERYYKIVSPLEANYFVLHESSYIKYKKSIMNPFTQYPKWENIFHPRRDDFMLCQGIFKNDLPYELVKKFESVYYTPEMIILKWKFGSLLGYGNDILIYKR